MSANSFHGEYPEPLLKNDRLRSHRNGSVVVYCSPESEALALEIGEYADRCNRYLARLFGDDEPAGQNVYWLAKADWPNPPETYGFPYNVGPNTILAAADTDLPIQLALIADYMFLDRGGPDVSRMAGLLGLPDGAGGREVYEVLTGSTPFFVDYTLGFILPHEMTHGYCQERGLPEAPRWYYEGVAQWSALSMQKEIRGEREAEMVYAYYQLLWDRAGDSLKIADFKEADRLGHLNLDTPNYAWYHAGLLRMFRELASRKDSELLVDLLGSVSRRFRGHPEVPDIEMIGLFSEVVGVDLNGWFQEAWKIRG